MTSPLSRSDAPTRTAYWTRPQPEQPQPEPCWANRCTNDAAARMRFEMAMRGIRDAQAFGAGFCAALAFVEALDCFRRD